MHGIVSTSSGARDSRPSIRRRRVASAVLALAALVGGLAWRQSGARSTPPVTDTIRRGSLEQVVTATGKIQPRAYVDVGAQASGQLNRILVRVGDRVARGQRLVEIDPQVQAARVDADEAQLAQYAANLAEQQAHVDYAEATLARYATLMARDAASKLAYDQCQRDLRTARAKAEAIRAEIRQMESTLKADRIALGYTQIDAPISGTVVSIDAREGQTLNATYATPQVLRIADLGTMTVWTQVSEADVTRLRVGMPVRFTTLGHGDRRWSATLRQILPAPAKPERIGGPGEAGAPAAAANTVVVYTALFDVDNGAGDLWPEMTAQVSFVTASAENVLLAPVAALHGEGGATAVTVVDAAGRESERRVALGLRTRVEAEIVSGLAEGERVVTGRKPGPDKLPLVGFQL